MTAPPGGLSVTVPPGELSAILATVEKRLRRLRWLPLGVPEPELRSTAATPYRSRAAVTAAVARFCAPEKKRGYDVNKKTLTTNTCRMCTYARIYIYVFTSVTGGCRLSVGLLSVPLSVFLVGEGDGIAERKTALSMVGARGRDMKCLLSTTVEGFFQSWTVAGPVRCYVAVSAYLRAPQMAHDPIHPVQCIFVRNSKRWYPEDCMPRSLVRLFQSLPRGRGTVTRSRSKPQIVFLH